MGGVFYNEIDRFKAAWLRNLIEEGAIARGVVDERPIQEIAPEDLEGYDQCHFFAGIGLWSLCLRIAGWPDDRPVWTGSCPCQPFSVAGQRKGFDDPRHLWPFWFRLIGERRPDVLFGEQSDQAVAWLDLVQSDLEGAGYATGAVDLPAAGFGGAHRRQRFGFVADAHHAQWWSALAPWHDGRWPQTGRLEGHGDLGAGGGLLVVADAAACGWDAGRDGGSSGRPPVEPPRRRVRGRMADADGGVARDGDVQPRGEHGLQPAHRGTPDWLGDPRFAGLPDAELGIVRLAGWRGAGGTAQQPGDPPGAGPDWLLCRDRKWRPVEPGTCPLVAESPARMGRLRGYGDAIDVAAFSNLIGAYLDAAPPAPWRLAA